MGSRLLSASCGNLIDFIPESQPCHLDSSKSRRKKVNQLQTGNSNVKSVGEDIKSFYEDLISDKNSEGCSEVPPKTKQVTKSTAKKITKPRRKSHHLLTSASSLEEQNFFQSSSFTPSQRQNFKLLKCSQLGDKSTVGELLSNKNVNVNFKDFYGWTALMCAAKEGHSNVIELLLRHDADQSCINSSGDSAFSLAVNAGHDEVALFLQSCNSRNEDTTLGHQDSHELSSPEVFNCDICKQDVSQHEAVSHKTSTIHLFNSGFLCKSPTYFIPDSNRGFQMMLRSGWDSGKGLGPEGKGSKYPVKTVFKQDRVGLGGEDVKRKKAKVTHFGRDDRDAVKTHKENPLRLVSVRKAARLAAKSKERKEKRWEKNMRFEMG